VTYNDIYAVQIRHQNCLYQVNHVTVLTVFDFEDYVHLQKNGFMPIAIHHYMRWEELENFQTGVMPRRWQKWFTETGQTL